MMPKVIDALDLLEKSYALSAAPMAAHKEVFPLVQGGVGETVVGRSAGALPRSLDLRAIDQSKHA